MRKLFVAVLTGIVCQSCSVLFSGSTNAVIRSSDHGVALTCEGSSNKSSGTDSLRIRLSNNWDDYIVTASKPGYLTHSTPLIRNRFNKVKLLDAALPFAADAFVLSKIGTSNGNSSNGNTADETLVPIAYFEGTLGWLILGAGQWRIYPKSFNLPQLTPAPHRDPLESFVTLQHISADISPENSKRTYFSDFHEYGKGKSFYTSSDKEGWKASNLKAEDEVEDALKAFGYLDTTAGLIQSHFAFPELEATVIGINLTTVGNNYHMNVDAQWKLKDPVSGKEIHSEMICSESQWKIYSKNDNPEAEMLTDGLKHSVALFLLKDEVKRALRDYSVQRKGATTELEQLNILRNGPPANNIKEAATAVVTVKTEDGHGSGDIISNDGYIITNLHVVSSQLKDSVDILFSDGSQSKAKVLRYNASYDLCLLKTVPLHVTPLRFDTVSHVDIGEEVYAIGTPAEIELGQSITKGIVSGKRIFKNLTFIQSDVSINPGNSGGAMVTQSGEMIGVVDAKIIGTGFEGLGFAIPASQICTALGITVR